MAVWPVTLPCLFLDASETMQDGSVRTEMSAGPAKVRRRFSAVSRYLTTSITLDATQRGTLHTFFTTTLGQGADEFDLADPFGGATVSARFLSPPSYGYKSRSSSGARWYIASIALEILP